MFGVCGEFGDELWVDVFLDEDVIVGGVVFVV